MSLSTFKKFKGFWKVGLLKNAMIKFYSRYVDDGLMLIKRDNVAPVNVVKVRYWVDSVEQRKKLKGW